MSKTIYLIRHGDKENHRGNPGLTEKGKYQAQQTAEFIKSKSIQYLVSSPIERTKQTAILIAQANNLPLHFDDRLKERLNWGDDPTQSFESFLTTWQHTQQDRQWRPQVGDSSHDTGHRMQQAITEYAARSQNIVFVSHGGSIADFLCTINPSRNLAETEHHLAECSITIVEIDDSNHFNLITLGSTDHLQ